MVVTPRAREHQPRPQLIRFVGILRLASIVCLCGATYDVGLRARHCACTRIMMRVGARRRPPQSLCNVFGAHHTIATVRYCIWYSTRAQFSCYKVPITLEAIMRLQCLPRRTMVVLSSPTSIGQATRFRILPASAVVAEPLVCLQHVANASTGRAPGACGRALVDGVAFLGLPGGRAGISHVSCLQCHGHHGTSQ